MSVEDKTEISGSLAACHPCDKCKGQARKRVSYHLEDLLDLKKLFLTSPDEKERARAIRKGVALTADVKMCLSFTGMPAFAPCPSCGDNGYDDMTVAQLKALVDDFYRYGKAFEQETGEKLEHSITPVFR